MECVICKQSLGDDTSSKVATLGKKGSISINKASEARNDSIHALPGQQVHQECRRKYCNPQQIVRAVKLDNEEVHHDGAAADITRLLRSTEKQFDYSTDCFFCGKPAMLGHI